MTPTATPARIRLSPPSRHIATPAHIRPVTPAVRAMWPWLKVSVATAIMSAPVVITAGLDGLAWLLAVAGTAVATNHNRGPVQHPHRCGHLRTPGLRSLHGQLVHKSH